MQGMRTDQLIQGIPLYKYPKVKNVQNCKQLLKISAAADGGPRYQVCAR